MTAPSGMTLADYGLTREDEIRFRKKERGAWHYGHPHGVNKDGSITVGTTKGMRALMPEHLELKTTSPDGNVLWGPIENRPEYRDIAGWPGYKVGSDGTVWSMWASRDRSKPDKWKKLRATKHFSKYDKLIYLGVTLYRDRKPTTRTIHSLVLETFVGYCPPGMECCHSDGDPSNNNLSNLRWDTRQSNADDRMRHGTGHQGERHVFARLTESAVREIRARHANGEKMGDLATEYGFSYETIGKVCRRQSWKHVK